MTPSTATATATRFSREADAVGGTEAANPLMGFDKNDVMRGVEMLILALVAALMIFFVARPLLRGAGPGAGGGGQLAVAGPGGGPPVTRIVVTPDGQQMAVAADGTMSQLALPSPGDDNATIAMARVEGQVRQSAVKRVSEFVEKHPDESVSILRSWLHETA